MVLCSCVDEKTRVIIGKCLDGAYLFYLFIGALTGIGRFIYLLILFLFELIFLILWGLWMHGDLDESTSDETKSKVIDIVRSDWEILSIFLMFYWMPPSDSEPLYLIPIYIHQVCWGIIMPIYLIGHCIFNCCSKCQQRRRERRAAVRNHEDEEEALHIRPSLNDDDIEQFNPP